MAPVCSRISVFAINAAAPPGTPPPETLAKLKKGAKRWSDDNAKTKADNWFDENRVWNEENRDYEVRRAQMYMVQGFILGNYILGVKTLVTMIYNQMITRDRYVRDTYKELDNSELLMYSWGWSIMQRFAVNEPFLILIGVLLPLLFATECCANLCTESCNNALGVAVAMCITFLKRMRRA